jgi:PTH1 family peptidyl-tRNA hydrolase
MNESGVTARAVAKTPKDIEQLIVLHDEIDLPVGAFRVVHDRGAGGHNGVTSIIQTLGTQAFTRIRIGVSPVDASGKMVKPRKDDVADFVLASFTPVEKLALNKCLQKVADAVVLIAEEGIETAMNKYN